VGDDVDEDVDAVEGSDRVTIPRFLVPSFVDESIILIE